MQTPGRHSGDHVATRIALALCWLAVGCDEAKAAPSPTATRAEQVELPEAWLSPCPEGMLHVPGGAFSSSQQAALRAACVDRCEPEQLWTRTPDYCLDRTEYTWGDLVRAVDSEQAPADVVQAYRRLDDERHSRQDDTPALEPGIATAFLENRHGSPDGWDPALSGWAHSPLRASETVASLLCEARGGHVVRLEEFLWAYWGGTEQRRYPWGSDATITQSAKALPPVPSTFPVDLFPEGTARWGHTGLGTNGIELVDGPGGSVICNPVWWLGIDVSDSPCLQRMPDPPPTSEGNMRRFAAQNLRNYEHRHSSFRCAAPLYGGDGEG